VFEISRPKVARRIAGLTVATALLLAPQALASDGGRLLVTFAPGVSAHAAGQILGAHGARSLRTIPHIGVAVVSAPSGARAALAREPGVQAVEPDAVATPQETVPDDPYFPTGALAFGGGAWGWYRSHTTQAWDVTLGDPSITIAILDTGLKPTALDFDGQVTAGWNVLANSPDTTSGAGNHGTYVAGVAGLAINSGSGNAGYCPRCRLMPVQIGTDTGAAYSDMATGIIWAAGIAGLVLSANPLLSGPQVEQALEGSAVATSFSVRYGEVDAMAALRSIGFSDPQAPGAPANTIAPRILLQTNGDQNSTALAGAPAVGQVLVRGQGAWQGSSPLVLSTARWNRCNPTAAAASSSARPRRTRCRAPTPATRCVWS
jgi:hypothetical protein